MSAQQRLWTAADGAVCVLVTRDTAPRFEIAVVRGGTVLRREAFYSEAPARMVADGWFSAVEAMEQHAS